jgi:hypothetical protein
VRWRRFFVLTTYLYGRVGEVKAISFEDIDFEVARAHLAASTHVAVLACWLERAATATTEAEVFVVEGT